jgi:hypothetical protein
VVYWTETAFAENNPNGVDETEAEDLKLSAYGNLHAEVFGKNDD